MKIPEGIHIVHTKPQRGKKVYYYARKKKRICGQSRVVWSFSLGTAGDIVRHYVTNSLDYIEFKPFSFGLPAAFLAISEKLDFFNLIDDIAPKKMIEGTLTTSQYLFAIMVGRSFAPVSKTKIGKYFTDTYLNLLWKPTTLLNTQNFNNHMDKIESTDDKNEVHNIGKITEGIAIKFRELGYSPEYFIWDTTNFSTNIENFENKKLLQKGKPKDMRFDRNIVGTGVAVTDDGMPVYHNTYPGNVNDAKLFREVIEDTVAKLKKLYGKRGKIILVFDKGNNSPEGMKKVLKKCHVIGSVPFEMASDLLDVPLEKFKFLYRTSNGNIMKGYQTTRKLWDEDFEIIVTYNEETARRQKRTWERSKEKIEKGLKELKEKFEEKGGRGKKMSVKGLTVKINEIVHKQYRSLYDWNIDEQNRKFEYNLIPEKEKELKKKQGKNLIFTDLKGWDMKKIVKGYHSKSKIERAFRWLHGKLLISVPPIYHNKDDRIRVHIFACLMALTFVHMIKREVNTSVSDEKLLNELKNLQVAILQNNLTGESKLQVQAMGPVQSTVFSALRLDRYLKII